MTIQMIQQGIAALRAGQTAEGERFLLIGLRSAEVTGQWRAAACLWLANLYTDQLTCTRTSARGSIWRKPSRPTRTIRK